MPNGMEAEGMRANRRIKKVGGGWIVRHLALRFMKPGPKVANDRWRRRIRKWRKETRLQAS